MNEQFLKVVWDFSYVDSDCEFEAEKKQLLSNRINDHSIKEEKLE